MLLAVKIKRGQRKWEKKKYGVRIFIRKKESIDNIKYTMKFSPVLKIERVPCREYRIYHEVSTDTAIPI